MWEIVVRPTVEHSFVLAFDLDYKDAKDQFVEGSARERRNEDGVVIKVSYCLDSSSFRSYHQSPTAKGVHRIRNPSENMGHWFTPASDGKMHVIGSLEEKEPVHFRKPKDYLGFYSHTTAYQTLDSSTLGG
ncbi:hypothetical protein V6N13_076669 [Hibiscus sabdariffa]|uniref:Uncharacterized protein n=1 Tax=Hibiscus sabdariffa TaxID=183260 RepID=A0ABR2NP30_9ROSI